MTMTVTIAVNGETVADVSVVNRGPTTTAEGNDPDGERVYVARRYQPFLSVPVTHLRGDGALVLASKALAALDDALGGAALTEKETTTDA